MKKHCLILFNILSIDSISLALVQNKICLITAYGINGISLSPSTEDCFILESYVQFEIVAI